MTDAKPATDMPTLETVVKSWREAPYKPATDDQIEAMRSRLKIEEEYEMPSWNRNSVAILIARIDAERARVKVLEDAGEEAFHVLAGCDCDNGVEHAGMNEGDHHKSLALDRLRALLPTLKEPANDRSEAGDGPRDQPCPEMGG